MRDNGSAEVSQESNSEENISVQLGSDTDIFEERANEHTDETDAWILRVYLTSYLTIQK